jgi:hypothetical protein
MTSDYNCKRARSDRAPPRKRKDDSEEAHQPMFLKKTFAMITNCPPHIGESFSPPCCSVNHVDLWLSGGWTEIGDTFIIRDVFRFTNEIIPHVYKHNKFPSFVRQLNFCEYSAPTQSIEIVCSPLFILADGFRKVKPDTISAHHADWWEFKHPNFRKGEPHLMSEIKKSTHFGEHPVQ